MSSQQLDQIALENFDLGKLLEDPPKDKLVRLAKEISVQNQGKTNSCGPYAVSMALSYWMPDEFGPNKDGRKIGAEIKYRISEQVPLWIGGGATLPNGLCEYLKRYRFQDKKVHAKDLDILKRYINAGCPCIVAVSVDNKFFRPHYRVAVGFNDLNQGIYFNDSSRRIKEDNFVAVGNNKVSYELFSKEWKKGIFHIWKNWFIPVYPVKT